MDNLYHIIGVSREATSEEIKKAYKVAAGKLHPDKNVDDPDATLNFQKLYEAYCILKNPATRRRYDETGATTSEPTREENADALIAGIYLELAEQGEFLPDDYMLETTKRIQNALRHALLDAGRLKVLALKLSYLIENTAAKDSFIAVLNSRLEVLRDQKEQAESGALVMQKALEVIAEYRYTGKTRQPVNRPWQNADPYIS